MGDARTKEPDKKTEDGPIELNRHERELIAASIHLANTEAWISGNQLLMVELYALSNKLGPGSLALTWGVKSDGKAWREDD